MRRSGGRSNCSHEAVAARDVGRRRLGIEVVDHRGVAHHRIDRSAQDARQDVGVGVAHGHHGVGRTRQASLVAAQQLLPRSRQAGHAAGLAVDVVGVVDDDAAEVLAQRHRQRERDDALGLPHVGGLHLLGDDLRPGPRHAQVAQRLDGAPDGCRAGGAAARRCGRSVIPGLGQVRRRQPRQRLGLADARDGVVVELLGRGQARAPAGDDGDVVAGLAQRDRRLPGAGVGHVGVVDEDGDADGACLAGLALVVNDVGPSAARRVHERSQITIPR